MSASMSKLAISSSSSSSSAAAAELDAWPGCRGGRGCGAAAPSAAGRPAAAAAPAGAWVGEPGVARGCDASGGRAGQPPRGTGGGARGGPGPPGGAALDGPTAAAPAPPHLVTGGWLGCNRGLAPPPAARGGSVCRAPAWAADPAPGPARQGQTSLAGPSAAGPASAPPPTAEPAHTGCVLGSGGWVPAAPPASANASGPAGASAPASGSGSGDGPAVLGPAPGVSAGERGGRAGLAPRLLARPSWPAAADRGGGSGAAWELRSAMAFTCEMERARPHSTGLLPFLHKRPQHDQLPVPVIPPRQAVLAAVESSPPQGVPAAASACCRARWTWSPARCRCGGAWQRRRRARWTRARGRPGACRWRRGRSSAVRCDPWRWAGSRARLPPCGSKTVRRTMGIRTLASAQAR
jgi:hypothetical protein